MTQFLCKGLYDGNRWFENALIKIDDSGFLVSIEENATPKTEEVRNGYFLPGLVDAHSHAFQYAMVGRTEFKNASQQANDFWSWREAMYHLALSVSKEDIQTIATRLYAELLRNGYTSVVEFHYLHHDLDGTQYAKSTEHIEALSLAALASGIRLTIIPVFYSTGNFAKVASPEQRRFLFSSVNQYREFLAAARETIERAQVGVSDPGENRRLRLGWGIHSLRAATEKDIKDLFANRPNSGPMHIHIAEQEKEVVDCEELYGKRPIEWLLQNFELTDADCLVHATHLSANEIKSLANSEAQVVLCPSTEGNLGDGFFPIEEFAQYGGNWSIGSDSHIGLSPWEELRWLDYQARLRTKARNPLATYGSDLHSGSYLWQNAWRNGLRASGSAINPLAPGQPFDALYVEDDFTSSLPRESCLDYLVFHAGSRAIREVFVQGQSLVRDGEHPQDIAVGGAFERTLDRVWQKPV